MIIGINLTNFYNNTNIIREERCFTEDKINIIFPLKFTNYLEFIKKETKQKFILYDFNILKKHLIKNKNKIIKNLINSLTDKKNIILINSSILTYYRDKKLFEYLLNKLNIKNKIKQENIYFIKEDKNIIDIVKKINKDSKKQNIPLMKIDYLNILNLYKKNNISLKYNIKTIKAITIELSRGCLFNCSFCYINQLNNKKYNNLNRKFKKIIFKPRKTIEKELLEIKKLGYRYVMIYDNSFLFNFLRKDFLKLIEILKKSGLKFFCNVDPFLLDKEKLEILKDFCIGFSIGLETGDKNTLKKMNKPYNIEKIKKLLKRYNNLFFIYVSLIYKFILKDNFNKTLALIKHIKPSFFEYNSYVDISKIRNKRVNQREYYTETYKNKEYLKNKIKLILSLFSFKWFVKELRKIMKNKLFINLLKFSIIFLYYFLYQYIFKKDNYLH